VRDVTARIGRVTATAAEAWAVGAVFLGVEANRSLPSLPLASGAEHPHDHGG
jgi:hypothetical protein